MVMEEEEEVMEVAVVERRRWVLNSGPRNHEHVVGDDDEGVEDSKGLYVCIEIRGDQV